jgi:hypothetical protein
VNIYPVADSKSTEWAKALGSGAIGAAGNLANIAAAGLFGLSAAMDTVSAAGMVRDGLPSINPNIALPERPGSVAFAADRCAAHHASGLACDGQCAEVDLRNDLTVLGKSAQHLNPCGLLYFGAELAWRQTEVTVGQNASVIGKISFERYLM